MIPHSLRFEKLYYFLWVEANICPQLHMRNCPYALAGSLINPGLGNTQDLGQPLNINKPLDWQRSSPAGVITILAIKRVLHD
jgi:hypothetical protein